MNARRFSTSTSAIWPRLFSQFKRISNYRFPISAFSCICRIVVFPISPPSSSIHRQRIFLAQCFRGDSRNTRFDLEFEWHQHWNHEGFLLAYSDSSSADLPQIVVNKRGGIFEWRVLEGKTYTGVPIVAFECKLQPSEFESLKNYLDTLPQSQAISQPIS